MQQHLDLRLKKCSIQQQRMFRRSLCLLEQRCGHVSNCRAPISAELLNKWRLKNGLRLTNASENSGRTTELHLCEEHLHTHTAHDAMDVHSILTKLRRKGESTNDTIHLVLPEAPDTILRRITIRFCAASQDDKVLATAHVDDFPSKDNAQLSPRALYECQELDRILRRIPHILGHGERTINVTYKRHAAPTQAPIIVDDDEDIEEEDEEEEEEKEDKGDEGEEIAEEEL
jgi:hypothetical protein